METKVDWRQCFISQNGLGDAPSEARTVPGESGDPMLNRTVPALASRIFDAMEQALMGIGNPNGIANQKQDPNTESNFRNAFFG